MFVTTAFDVIFLSDTSDHVLADMMTLLTKVSLQAVNAIALLSLNMSGEY